MYLLKNLAKRVTYSSNKQGELPSKKDIVEMKSQSIIKHGCNNSLSICKNSLSIRSFQPPTVGIVGSLKGKSVTIVNKNYPGKMMKAQYGEMNMNRPSYSPQAGRAAQGCIIAASTSGIKDNPSSRSRHPVGLGVGNPPLGLPPLVRVKGQPGFPLIPPLKLVKAMMPLIIVSTAYYSTYSINDLLLIFKSMGLDPIWIKEMLGISSSCPSDITPLVYAVQMQQQTGIDGSSLPTIQIVQTQQTGIDGSSPPPIQDTGTSEYSEQRELYFQKKLMALIIGGVLVGAIFLWIAKN